MNSPKKIQRNRHPAGRINNIYFGVCQVADGLVRILSCGFLHSTFPVDQAREVARKNIQKLKAKAL
jgi:hypothetical protein